MNETKTEEAETTAVIKRFLQRAEGGDREAIEVVRNLAGSKLGKVWEAYGNLPFEVQSRLIAEVAGKNALTRGAVTEKMEALRQELNGPNPSPLERLLVERIVLCWLQMYHEDVRDAQKGERAESSSGLNRQRRAETAQRRFLAAVKALATVRRLALPMLQVNVAEKQVNIAAPMIGDQLPAVANDK